MRPARTLVAPFFLALLAGSVPAARAQISVPEISTPYSASKDKRPASAAAWRRWIVSDHDLAAAQALLSDAALQDELRASSPDEYGPVFVEAAALSDLAVRFRRGDRSGEIRTALFRLPDCRLCQDPGLLEVWAARLGRADSPGKVREATWHWESLDDGKRACLSAEGYDARRWGGEGLPARQERLLGCVKDELAVLKEPFPRDQAAFDRQFAAAKKAVNFLAPDAFREVLRRIELAEGLLKARRAAEAAGDAKARAALAAAAAADPESAGAALADYFDAETRRRVLPDAAQDADAGRGAPRYRAVEGLLGPALLSAVAGTWAGDELAPFYAREPLRLRIRDLGEDLGMYDPKTGEINFSRGRFDELLLAEGLTVADLERDPAALARTAAVLSPVFVHEAAHQRQHAWRRDNALPDIYSTGVEVEAMEEGALFLLEKMRRDKGFAAEFGRAAKDGASLALDPLSLAARLRDDADDFRRRVRDVQYQGTPTLDDAAASGVESALAARADPQARAGEAAYPRYRERLEAADARIDGRRRILRSFFLPPRPKSEPPPPIVEARR